MKISFLILISISLALISCSPHPYANFAPDSYYYVISPYSGERVDVTNVAPHSVIADPRQPELVFNMPKKDYRSYSDFTGVGVWYQGMLPEEIDEMQKEIAANNPEPSIFQLLGDGLVANQGYLNSELSKANRRADEIRRTYPTQPTNSRASNNRGSAPSSGFTDSPSSAQSSGSESSGSSANKTAAKKRRMAFIRLQIKNENGNMTDTAFHYVFSTFSEVRKQAKQKYPNHIISDTTIAPSNLSGGGCYTIVEGSRKDPKGATQKRYAIGFGSDFNVSSADARKRLNASIVNWGNVSTVKTGTF